MNYTLSIPQHLIECVCVCVCGIRCGTPTKQVRKPTSQNLQKTTMEVPVIQVSAPPGRDYANILLQTKTVYDQLLAHKHAKLMEGLLQKKKGFDQQVNSVAQKDETKGIELGVRAQDILNTLQRESDTELRELYEDYQQKMDKMSRELENQWRQKHN